MAKTDLCTTEARRAEIAARCEAATRGPHWTVVMGGLIAHSGVALEPDDWEPEGDTARWSLHNLTDGDADMFNVAAVDLPDLLADVTTLLERERVLREALKRAFKDGYADGFRDGLHDAESFGRSVEDAEAAWLVWCSDPANARVVEPTDG